MHMKCFMCTLTHNLAGWNSSCLGLFQHKNTLSSMSLSCGLRTCRAANRSCSSSSWASASSTPAHIDLNRQAQTCMCILMLSSSHRVCNLCDPLRLLGSCYTPCMRAARSASPASAASAASAGSGSACLALVQLHAPQSTSHLQACQDQSVYCGTAHCPGSKRPHSQTGPAQSKTMAGRCACCVEGTCSMPAQCSDAAHPVMQCLDLIRYLGFTWHKQSPPKK